MRVLVLARSYPNPEMPLLGLWTERLTRAVTESAEVKVIAPVPYLPPVPSGGRLGYFERFRRVPRMRWDDSIEVLHPRFLAGPGSSTQEIEGAAYALAAGRAAAKLHRRFPFDLIHAHFTYPDGFAACMIGRRFGAPVVITEHVPWLPWLEKANLVRRQASWAARSCAVQVPVSRYVRRTVMEVMGNGRPEVEPIPMLVDEAVFKPASGVMRKPASLLFVGAVRHAKGLDVLIDALPELIARRADLRLVVAGEPFYRSYRQDFEAVKARARALAVDRRIDWVGSKSPGEVARLMSQSAVSVMPSRAESFGSVLIESLACGTPVVATRSGGPEDIVTDDVGILVDVEDPHSLAAAISSVLDQPGRYDPTALRRYALDRFGRDVVGRRILAQYESALRRREHP